MQEKIVPNKPSPEYEQLDQAITAIDSVIEKLEGKSIPKNIIHDALLNALDQYKK